MDLVPITTFSMFNLVSSYLFSFHFSSFLYLSDFFSFFAFKCNFHNLLSFGYFDLQFTLTQLIELLLKNNGNLSPKQLEDASFRNTIINLFTFFYILFFKKSKSLYLNFNTLTLKFIIFIL